MKVMASQFKNKRKIVSWHRNAQGFSISELLTVVAIIFILSAMSIPYLFSYTKLYKSEDQALKVMDLMREAGQLALARRRTVRFEIDLTQNAVLIIDENGSDDDVRLKMVPLEKPVDVRIDMAPDGVAAPAPPSYTDAEFVTDGLGHTTGGSTVSGHLVWQARFRSDGTVIDGNGNPISATIYSWPPVTSGSTASRNSNTEVRAITIFGGSGAMRYWKHKDGGFVPYQ